jgi:dolichyl-phosphate-mannose--protein O-mannosyl transferase
MAGDGVPEQRKRPRWTLLDWVLVACVSGIAGVIRLVGVTSTTSVFDEGYYASDACLFALGPGTPCHDVGAAQLAPHPPLGMSIIGFGIRLFGYRPGGWRVTALVAGTLTVVLVYVLAKVLLRSTLGATLASGALAIDFLHFVHSRLAMLDVFLTLFGVATVLALVLDRDHIGRPRRRRWAARPWRLVAGAMAGAAVATKWPGLAFLICTLVLAVAWEVRSRDPGPGRFMGTMRDEGSSMLVCLVFVPALVYVLSYVGWIDGSILAWPWSEGSWIRSFLAEQTRMLRFHDGLDVDHFYASPPWSWPLLKRPIVYFYEPSGQGYRIILALGNPVVWWVSMVSVAWMAGAWARRRGGSEGAVLCAFAFVWVPWFAVDVVRSPLFLFYLMPAVPFMAIAVGWAAIRVSDTRAGRAVIAAFGIGAIALFAYYYPVLVASPLSVAQWRDRVLFADCDLAGLTLDDIDLGPKIETPVDAPGPYPEALLRLGAPPQGWCWI